MEYTYVGLMKPKTYMESIQKEKRICNKLQNEVQIIVYLLIVTTNDRLFVNSVVKNTR